MGVNIRDLVTPREITLESLAGKALGIDAFNWIYQFISSIRQPDGSPLSDSHGNTTSHLVGLFYRMTRLLELGIKPCFVFDGIKPDFKVVTEARSARKDVAEKKYKEALKQGDYVRAKSLASQTSRLTAQMISECKEFLSALGVPYIEAPSEGEAQVAFMTLKGDFYSSASQDFDTLLFGSPRLIRNINFTGRKKMPGRNAWTTINPEVIELSDTLKALGISREQLIILGVLVGTDYNPEGVKGVGPKTALKLVREHKDSSVFNSLEWNSPFSPESIIEFFNNPPVTKDYELSWSKINDSLVREILVSRHDFSDERVSNTLKKLLESQKANTQKDLGAWF